jgi:hypothetical protein
MSMNSEQLTSVWQYGWFIEHSTSHQLLWCIDSFALRNPPLRQAPNR